MTYPSGMLPAGLGDTPDGPVGGRSVEARSFSPVGAKSLTFPLVTAARRELTDGAPAPRVISEILAAGREMLSHPVETLPGVAETLNRLSEQYRLVLITKGDLMDQERKLAASGLGDLFSGVEIVSEKTADIYDRAFRRHGTGAQQAAMVGNSMKSDVLPALQAGAWAAHIPYAVTWAHELADAPQNEPKFAALEAITEVPPWAEGATQGR